MNKRGNPDFFTISDTDKPLEIDFKYDKAGHCFIVYKRHDGKEGRSFDCFNGKYHEGNRISGWTNHKLGCQWFIVNQDRTISPTHSPYMVFGIKNDELVLVKNSDSDKLVFKYLKPSYDVEKLKVLTLKASSHKGKGVVIKDGGLK